MQGLLQRMETISNAISFNRIKNVMRPQIRSFKSCNKGTLVYKDYKR